MATADEEAEAAELNRRIRTVNKRREKEIQKYRDRWLLRPLTAAKVNAIEWQDTTLTLCLDRELSITVGIEADLTPRLYLGKDPDRYPISLRSREDVEHGLDSTLAHGHGEADGTLNFGMKNGWQVIAWGHRKGAEAIVYFQDQILWSRAGLNPIEGFTIITENPTEPTVD